MTIAKQVALLRRKYIIRKKISGLPDRPRLSVYRSLKHIYSQVIDDTTSRTIAAASTLSKELKDKLSEGSSKTKTDKAKLVGELLGKKLLEKGIHEVVFDRGGRKYHGRIKALADGVRSAGVKF
ncbi:MAG: 50S ribosomal protein L18 [Elusimicrobiota bacterium]|nr:50S ribosomal protein L18 [Elusimicrobiota bacterium]